MKEDNLLLEIFFPRKKTYLGIQCNKYDSHSCTCMHV